MDPTSLKAENRDLSGSTEKPGHHLVDVIEGHVPVRSQPVCNLREHRDATPHDAHQEHIRRQGLERDPVSGLLLLGCAGDFVSQLSSRPYGAFCGLLRGLEGNNSWTYEVNCSSKYKEV